MKKQATEATASPKKAVKKAGKQAVSSKTGEIIKQQPESNPKEIQKQPENKVVAKAMVLFSGENIDNSPQEIAEVPTITEPAQETVPTIVELGTPKTGEIQPVPMELIVPNPGNPRQVFNETDLLELGATMQTHGLLEPIIVRQNPNTTELQYMIVAGERRFRAALLIGWTTIPAIVKNMTEQQAIAASIIENLQRKDISAWEEAAAYELALKTLKSPSDPAKNISVKELATMLGVDFSMIFKRKKLANLVYQPAIDALRGGTLDYSFALLIARLDATQQKVAYDKLFYNYGDDFSNHTNNLTGEKNTSLRMTATGFANWIAKLYVPMQEANFDTENPNIDKEAGACTDCPLRTKNQPDFEGKDLCTKKTCFENKTVIHIKTLQNEFKQDDIKALVGIKKQTGSNQFTVQGNEVRLNEKKKNDDDIPVIINKAESEHHTDHIGKIYYIPAKLLHKTKADKVEKVVKKEDKSKEAQDRVSFEKYVAELLVDKLFSPKFAITKTLNEELVNDVLHNNSRPSASVIPFLSKCVAKHINSDTIPANGFEGEKVGDDWANFIVRYVGRNPINWTKAMCLTLIGDNLNMDETNTYRTLSELLEVGKYGSSYATHVSAFGFDAKTLYSAFTSDKALALPNPQLHIEVREQSAEAEPKIQTENNGSANK